MPKVDTGTKSKADRRQLTIESVRAFRLEQVNKGLAFLTKPETMGVVSEKNIKGKGKGKQRTRNSPDAGEPAASALVPSPSLPVASLNAMTLESGLSSAADTPSDNPAPVSPSPISASPGHSAPDSSRLHVRIPGGLAHSSKPTPKSPKFAVEVPGTSYYASDSSKYVTLEKRVAKLEKLVYGMESQLDKLDK